MVGSLEPKLLIISIIARGWRCAIFKLRWYEPMKKKTFHSSSKFLSMHIPCIHCLGGPEYGALMFFLVLALTNSWNKRPSSRWFKTSRCPCDITAMTDDMWINLRLYIPVMCSKNVKMSWVIFVLTHRTVTSTRSNEGKSHHRLQPSRQVSVLSYTNHLKNPRISTGISRKSNARI